jgi:phosphotransferase system IIB component
VEAAANRLLVELADPGKLDGPALIRAGARGVAAAGANRRQVLLGGDASAVAARMAESRAA